MFLLNRYKLMELKIVKGGVLNLNNRNLFTNDPRCYERQCDRINIYIDALFNAYAAFYGVNVPNNNAWHTYDTSTEYIYIKFKIEHYGIHRTRRILICYRDTILSTDRSYQDLIHLSLNENGSMHMTFDYVDPAREARNLHIFTNINPDVNDGLNDLIEFVNYIKRNIFERNDLLQEFVSYAVQNRDSVWYAYFTREFERLQELDPSINIEQGRGYFLDIFREKYLQIFDKFISMIYLYSRYGILELINRYKPLGMYTIS